MSPGVGSSNDRSRVTPYINTGTPRGVIGAGIVTRNDGAQLVGNDHVGQGVPRGAIGGRGDLTNGAPNRGIITGLDHPILRPVSERAVRPFSGLSEPVPFGARRRIA